MAAQGRTEPSRWPQRCRTRIVQAGDRRHTQGSGKGCSRHTAEEAAQGQLLGKDGQRQGAAHEGWEEDQIEALTRGMGASW